MKCKKWTGGKILQIFGPTTDRTKLIKNICAEGKRLDSDVKERRDVFFGEQVFDFLAWDVSVTNEFQKKCWLQKVNLEFKFVSSDLVKKYGTATIPYHWYQSTQLFDLYWFSAILHDLIWLFAHSITQATVQQQQFYNC